MSNFPCLTFLKCVPLESGMFVTCNTLPIVKLVLDLDLQDHQQFSLLYVFFVNRDSSRANEIFYQVPTLAWVLC